MLYQQLFPDRAKHLGAKPSSAPHSTAMARTKGLHLHSSLQTAHTAQMEELLTHAVQRSLQYERKLSSIGQRTPVKNPRASMRRKPPDGAPMSASGMLV